MAQTMLWTTPMNGISNHWWTLVVRGAASFALAGLLLLGPAWSSTTFVAFAFAAYAILDGAASLGLVVGARGVETTTYVGRGVLGIVLGALVFACRVPSPTALFMVVAIWGIGTGGLEQAFGSRTWSAVPHALGFMLTGILSVGLGLTALCFSHESAATLRAFLALYGVVNGVTAMAFGDRLHRPSLRAA